MDGRVKPGHGGGGYFDLSSDFRIASVIAVVPTLFMPGCMMSPGEGGIAKGPVDLSPA